MTELHVINERPQRCMFIAIDGRYIEVNLELTVVLNVVEEQLPSDAVSSGKLLVPPIYLL